LFDRVGGALGDNGSDVFAVFGGGGDADNLMGEVSARETVMQAQSADECCQFPDLSQAVGAEMLFPDVVQPVSGIAASALSDAIHGATSKTTPVDADELPLIDSAASFSLKKLTWANLKATLSAWINGDLISASFTSITSSTTGKVATTFGVGNATPSASGAGVSFPATQNASTDANTLDDYEEGTWTPTDTSGAGLSLTNETTATYTKIGRQVTVQFAVLYPATASGVAALIGGLPFANAAGNFSGVCISQTEYGTAFTGAVAPGSSNLAFYTFGNAAVTNANVSAKRIRGSATYFV
jgi:hypothetical protein